MPDFSEIKSIRNFKSLVKYLRTKLDWPIDEDMADDLTFDYKADELGLDEQVAVKIREIKQVRPLVEGQPWGIFWLDFEPKRLPVVVMRRVLAALVRTKRSRKRSTQAVWDLRELMFISATGEGNRRGISFAHFHETPQGAPQLRTFSWDVNERHFYFLEHINLEALRWPDDPADIEGWREHWDAAFTAGHREVITTSQALASRMAELAAATRELVNEVYQYEQSTGPLHKLHDAFRRVLIHDLEPDDFADMYAQTVTYGLFSAAATPHQGAFTLQNVVNLIPKTNPFLRDLFARCLQVGQGGKYELDLDELGVGELMNTLERANMQAILHDFGKQSHEHKEDPVIHFYESFLREYDPEKKAKRGVFYTPDPVVGFIVRSVDYLLRTEFGCADGLATVRSDDLSRPKAAKATTTNKEFNVQILDPATGTGTFLKWIIELIYETFTRNATRRGLAPKDIRKAWNEYVPKHLLPRLYGFELMMAPYAVAHMKLGLALQETEYDFHSDERLHVYLTNALQPAHEIPRVDAPFLAQEAADANVVKTETPITVVIGNPPYSGHSANKGEWIGSLVRSYYQVDGAPLGERNPKWLQDDYVKFIRFGQWRIEETGEGILAMITNHSYLDNPTFRGMRQQLMQTFSEIYVLDLHGNSKKKETAPDGSKDENVFDIQQGVAICLMVKRPGSTGPVKAYHAHLYGLRSTKYETLASVDMQGIEWKDITPCSPFYLFISQDIDLRAEYEQGWKTTEAMPVNVLGFQSHRDEFAVDFDRNALYQRIKEMRDRRLSDNVYAERYGLHDNRDWQLAKARSQLRRARAWEDDLIDCLYRPFDLRFCYFSEVAMDYPRRELIQHVAGKDNLCLNTVRQTKMDVWQHAVVSNRPAPAVYVELKDGSNNFPLYLYPTDELMLFEEASGAGPGGRRPNLSPKFIADVEERLCLRFIPDGTGDLIKTFGPEDVFHYLYAVFHSPTYRERYSEFLKIDFPRLPLTRDVGLFRSLAALGAELVSLHLMESPKLDKPITKFVVRSDDFSRPPRAAKAATTSVVASGCPRYGEETVWINDTQGFAGVPEDVWEFHVGGYQVCSKWLKDRRGRELSAEDKTHYCRIVVALKETIRLMDKIDETIPAWPME